MSEFKLEWRIPVRKEHIVNENYYHVCNRGNNRNNIFFESKNYDFLLEKIKQNFSNTSDLIAYCLMPNHFHLLVKILDDNNFSHAMNKIFIGYTKAINSVYGRSGHLFEGRFKLKLIDQNNYLLHLSRYIHLNPVRAKLVKDPEDWAFSRYKIFLAGKKDKLIK